MNGYAEQPWLIGALRRLGNAGVFLFQALRGMKCTFFHVGETMRQVYSIGVRSLVIIMMITSERTPME